MFILFNSLSIATHWNIYSKMESPASGVSTSSASETKRCHHEADDAVVEKAAENEAIQASSDNPTVEKKSFKFKLTVFMICFISVVVSMDSVIVASALPAITVDLKGSSLEAFWVGTSYLLAQTVSMT